MPLYIVGTPIGNLKDITQRAVDTLKCSDIILCESYERASILTGHLDISGKRIITFREDNHKRLTPEIISFLKNNLKVAMISDAGMPSISDPGSYLINEAFENNLPIIPVPGPTAFATALSICGFNNKEVVFIGFLPRKKNEIIEIIDFYRERNTLLIFYESPQRLIKTIRIFDEIDPFSSIFIVREMTKQYEEFLRGNPKSILSSLSGRILKGEITVVVRLSKRESQQPYDRRLLNTLKKENLGTKVIAKILADYHKLPVRSVYNEIIQNKH